MDLQLVAEGLLFPEGPVAMADGSVILVEIRRGTLTRVTPDGKRRTIAELGGGSQRHGHRAGRRSLHLQQRPRLDLAER